MNVVVFCCVVVHTTINTNHHYHHRHHHHHHTQQASASLTVAFPNESSSTTEAGVMCACTAITRACFVAVSLGEAMEVKAKAKALPVELLWVLGPVCHTVHAQSMRAGACG